MIWILWLSLKLTLEILVCIESHRTIFSSQTQKIPFRSIMALVCVEDYEKKAAETMAKIPWDYYQSGAGDELSLRLNRNAYSR